MPVFFPTARRAVESGYLGNTEVDITQIYIHDKTGRVLFGDPGNTVHVLGFEERMGWKRSSAQGVIRKANEEIKGETE